MIIIQFSIGFIAFSLHSCFENSTDTILENYKYIDDIISGLRYKLDNFINGQKIVLSIKLKNSHKIQRVLLSVVQICWKSMTPS